MVCSSPPIDNYTTDDDKAISGAFLTWTGGTSTSAQKFCKDNTDSDVTGGCEKLNKTLDNVLDQCSSLDNCESVQSAKDQPFFQMNEVGTGTQRSDSNFTLYTKKTST